MKRLLGEGWLVPMIDDLNRTCFTSGTISLQSCDACGALQHPPEEICRACQETQLSFREYSGEGKIESVAVVHQAVHPELEGALPYTIVVVSIDDAPGVNVVGNIVNPDAGNVAIGARVRAVFEEVEQPDAERLLIPQWEVQ